MPARWTRWPPACCPCLSGGPPRRWICSRATDKTYEAALRLGRAHRHGRRHRTRCSRRAPVPAGLEETALRAVLGRSSSVPQRAGAAHVFGGEGGRPAAVQGWRARGQHGGAPGAAHRHPHPAAARAGESQSGTFASARRAAARARMCACCWRTSAARWARPPQ